MKLLSVVLLLLLSTVYSQGNEGNNTDSFDVNVSSSYGIQAQPSNTTIVYPTKPQQIQDRSGKHEKHEDQLMEPTQFDDDVRYQVHEHFGDENVEAIHFLPTPQAYTSVTNPPPSLRDNNNLDNKEAASYPRPSLPEIQNVLTGVNSQELDVGKVPKHSKIVEVVRVPAVYELHLESDANRVLKLNPWTKELMSQSSNIENDFNGPQQVYHSVKEIPSLPQYDTTGDKYNFDKIPQDFSNLQLANVGEPKPNRGYGRGKTYRQQMMQPQYQEMSYKNYVQPSRGKKKYQPPANYNPAPQQYIPQKSNYGQQQLSSASSLNFGQQFNSGKNSARPQWNNAHNFGPHWSGENNFGHQVKAASNFGQHQYSVGKNYGQQQSSAGHQFGHQLTGEVGYEYYLPSGSNTKSQQAIEEGKYGQYPSFVGKRYQKAFPSSKNYGLQISPEKNYGHHQVSGGYEVFGASNPIPQINDDTNGEFYKNTQYRIPQQSETVKSHSKYPKTYNKSPQSTPNSWKHAAHYHKHEEVDNQPAQEIVYKKPKTQPVQFEEVYINKYNVKQAEPKKVIPTYTQPKEIISYEKPEVTYKPTQTYEESAQNFQYSYPKTKKNSQDPHNQKYKPQWNSELNSEYLGDYYKKPQAIHEVPAPVFNGPNPYSIQTQSAPKVIYGKHSEHGPFKPQEYESVQETWQERYPESSEEVKYVHHAGSFDNFKTKQVSHHSHENRYNKGIVDSVPNDFHATLQTPTQSSNEQIVDENVKTEVRYEVQNNGGAPIYDSARPKVNYNRDVYVEEVPKIEQIPDQDEVQIIFAQNPSTETPHSVEIENNNIQNENYPKFESHKLNEQGELNNEVHPTKYTSVDFPQAFQPNKNRRMSTPPPPPPPQINYVLLIKERDIDD